MYFVTVDVIVLMNLYYLPIHLIRTVNYEIGEKTVTNIIKLNY